MTGDRYKDAVGALARSSEMPPERAARIEHDLLQAFVKHHTALPLTRPARARTRWRPWLAAAAALVAITGGIEFRRGWRTNAGVTLNHVTAEARPPDLADGPPSPAGSTSSGPSSSGAPATPTSRISISSSPVSPVRGRRAVSD